MPLAVTTAAIIQSRAGTNWTLDTTLANLDPDTFLKDFVVLFGSVVQSNTLFTKVSPVAVLYIGAPITTTTVQLRRRTPIDPIKEVLYGERFSSADWNREINRTSRRAAEYEVFGIGSIGDVTGTPNNAAYSSAWGTDTIFAPTRSALFTKIENVISNYQAADTAIAAMITGGAPLNSPAFTGVPTAPSPAPSTNSTQIQTAAGVRALLTSVADLKALQNATYPTAAKTTNTTELASTAFAHLANGFKKLHTSNGGATSTASATWISVGTITLTPRSTASQFLVLFMPLVVATGGDYGKIGVRYNADTPPASSQGFVFASAGTVYAASTISRVISPATASSITISGGILASAGTMNLDSYVLVAIEFENIL